MKRSLVFVGLAPSIALSQGTLLGSRQDPAARPEPSRGSSPMDALTPLVVCALILLAARWVLPRVAKAFGKPAAATGRLVTVEETVPFGPGTLSVVTVEGRRLLVGTSPSSIALVSDLTPAPGVPKPAESPAFFEMLDEAIASPPASAPTSAPLTSEPDAEAMSMDDALRLLHGAKSRLAVQPESATATTRLERLLKG